MGKPSFDLFIDDKAYGYNLGGKKRNTLNNYCKYYFMQTKKIEPVKFKSIDYLIQR